MYSLFYVLTNQHDEEFAPVRCNEQTLTRLVRYFEDANKLSALVFEGQYLNGNSTRQQQQSVKVAAAARHLYLFSAHADRPRKSLSPYLASKLTVLQEAEGQNIETGPFILVMDHRFCGLLASYALPSEGNNHAKTYEMIWTFDPNVAFTAVEYLMARISVQNPQERSRLTNLLNLSTPHSPSLRLALTLTTKLTTLMQRQNELEMAINRISSAISSTLELESILQAAVEEVGHALKSRRAAVVLWEEGTTKTESMSVYERPEITPATAAGSGSLPAIASLGDFGSSNGMANGSGNGTGPLSTGVDRDAPLTPGVLEISITYRNSVIGVLVVEDDTQGRSWEDEEVLMVRTVSDQLAVAISHARLFHQVQTQAITDSLTGLFNHGHFQERLSREIKIADRSDGKVSLILLDLDHLKRINDTHGHQAGDVALCHVARIMQTAIRDVDVCARYGGEEFVIILPGCDRESALTVAERVREAIAAKPIPKVGQLTASIGVATYSDSATSKEELVEMADRAMYLAKAAGRNRVRTLTQRSSFTDVVV